MSTASPDPCAEVSAVATHRAASSSDPYSATASRSSWSWYSGERQPLVTATSTPTSAAGPPPPGRVSRARGGRPATGAGALHTDVRGVRRCPAQRAEQGRVEVGHPGAAGVEDRGAGGGGNAGPA